MNIIKMKAHWYKLVFLILLVIILVKVFNRQKVAITDPHFELLGPFNLTELFPLNVEKDYTRLIDLNEFDFKINTFPCNKTNGPLLVVIVSTKPDHFLHRKTIRNTWGKNSDVVKLVFLIGETNNSSLNYEILKESTKYNDIIKGSFMDAYRNMTYKHVMGLKWTTYHCHSARYILKLDDDVFVNMEFMLKFLVTMSPWGAKKLILCQTYMNQRVMRTYRSKWRVTYNEYPDKYYPTYCAGYAVLYSPDVVRQLYIEAQKTRYFWIDDAHITGVLAKKIGVTPTDMGTLRFTKYKKILNSIFGFKYSPFYIFGPPDVTTEEILELWRATVKKIPLRAPI